MTVYTINLHVREFEGFLLKHFLILILPVTALVYTYTIVYAKRKDALYLSHAVKNCRLNNVHFRDCELKKKTHGNISKYIQVLYDSKKSLFKWILIGLF